MLHGASLGVLMTSYGGDDGEGKPKTCKENNLEETIEDSFQGIQVKQRLDRKKWKRLYQLLVRLSLAEEYKGR